MATVCSSCYQTHRFLVTIAVEIDVPKRPRRDQPSRPDVSAFKQSSVEEDYASAFFTAVAGRLGSQEDGGFKQLKTAEQAVAASMQ